MSIEMEVSIMRLFKNKETGALFELVLNGNEDVNVEGLVEVKAGTVDAATEKHVPVVEQDGKRLNVKVGSVAHPMTEEHYITSVWIEFEDGTIRRKGLTPSDAPETHFCLGDKTGKVTVYEYCNLHGLWKTEYTIQ